MISSHDPNDNPVRIITQRFRKYFEGCFFFQKGMGGVGGRGAKARGGGNAEEDYEGEIFRFLPNPVGRPGHNGSLRFGSVRLL